MKDRQLQQCFICCTTNWAVFSVYIALLGVLDLCAVSFKTSKKRSDNMELAGRCSQSVVGWCVLGK